MYVLAPISGVVLCVIFIYAFVSEPIDLSTFKSYGYKVVQETNTSIPAIEEYDDPAEEVFFGCLSNPKV